MQIDIRPMSRCVSISFFVRKRGYFTQPSMEFDPLLSYDRDLLSVMTYVEECQNS